MLEALPQPLRTEGFCRNNPAEDEAVKSAAETLGTVEQIQVLIRAVFDQQLQRLNDRWLVETRASSSAANVQIPNKLKGVRKRDAQRLEREALIAEIAEVTKTPVEFLQMMDERKVLPQPTWKNWPGSWTSAYRDAGLRKLIHQDKSRAVSRVLARRGR